MIEVLTGVVIGFVAAMTTIGLNAGNKILENDNLHKALEIKTKDARYWEAQALERGDELAHQRKMAEYWRAKCMNEHFDFDAAVSEEG